MELDPKEQLKSDMTAMASSATKNARGNYAAAYTMTTLSVVASIAATVMASSNINSKWAVALVASLPAAAIGIKNVFMFERKRIGIGAKPSDWSRSTVRWSTNHARQRKSATASAGWKLRWKTNGSISIKTPNLPQRKREKMIPSPNSPLRS